MLALVHVSCQECTAKAPRICTPHTPSGQMLQGPWKPEEDEQLRALVEGKGNKWLEIGEVMGRMGEACRDRWRTIGLVRAAPLTPPCTSKPHAVVILADDIFAELLSSVSSCVDSSHPGVVSSTTCQHRM
jgi:Myb-like DNA-binding domain